MWLVNSLRYFSLHLKRVILLTGAALVIFTLSDSFWLRMFVPEIHKHFMKLASLINHNNSQESNSYPINNDSFSWPEKELVYETPQNDLFTSLYIITPKIYNTRSSTSSSNSTRKYKVISCYKCPEFFIRHSLNLYNRDFKACPYSECTFVAGSRASSADVVLFFGGMLQETKPKRPAGQIWVKCYWESPAHYGYPTPYKPWKSAFNWTFNYRTDSDLFAPNNRLAWRKSSDLLPDSVYPPYKPWKSAFNWTFNYRTDSDLFAPNNRLAWRKSSDLLPDSVYLEIAKNKTRNAAWFVSNCETQSQREIYVKEMQKYIDVDIYGGCGNMTCGKSEEKDCETKLSTTYKFYLSFENSFCKDYVTEKLFRNIQYRSHIIPVVRGGFDYNKYIPNGIFVNSANFSSAKELSLYLKELGNDHERYARMLKEKDKLMTLNYKIDWCDFCEKVHTDNRTKVIPDIKSWSHDGACHRPTDIGKSS